MGIESTAHTFGCGIVTSSGKILANVKSEYVPPSGGIHPREASQHHSLKASSTIKKALEEAKINLNEVDAIAISLGPGLGPCLRTGATIARALALLLDKPLIPVNHCIAHIEIGRLITGEEDPLVVYVSGGNTIVSAFSDGRYRIFGETLDIALGNCLDVFARHLGLQHPGVPKLEAMAEKGRNFIPLPYIVKGQDVSYSGLLTTAIRKIGQFDQFDLSMSLLEVAYGMLAEVAERALAHTEKSSLLLTGGVARSPRLQRILKLVCEEHSAKFYVVSPELAGDNGAMIAWTGYLAFKENVTIPIESSYIKSKWRLDEVEIPWRK
ncbi:MAG: KEOPS complex N(6)-L-threonylcarbamoyladenine synthase Kae1 [Candidatus Methanomethyliaceae archaeon]|nr:KEOPS complex N(6)-L-threonylcarbamoyladenine synthase Kae1 [Candidatus Methanomethyliaceae archaeon]